MNRIILTLRSQLDAKSSVNNRIESSTEEKGGKDQETDLGSVYAQHRSQKLCSREGGEGRQLPRYLVPFSDNGLARAVPAVSAPASVSMSVSVASVKAAVKKSAIHDNVYASNMLKIDAELSERDNTATVTATVMQNPDTTHQSDALSSGSTYAPECVIPSSSSSSSSTSSCTISGGKTLSGTGVTYTPTSATIPTIIKPIIPPKKIMKLVGQAVKEWNMIEEGDRLLLGLSGGKDSLALLHILIALQV